jgi:hypothetical protein
VLNKTMNELYSAHKRGEISKEDYDRYGEDEANWEERRVKERVWQRPTAIEALDRYVTECIPWRKERGLTVHADLLQNMRMLIGRRADADLSQFEGRDITGLVDWAVANPQVEAAGARRTKRLVRASTRRVRSRRG